MLKALIEPKPSLPHERQLFTNAMLKAMIIPLLIEQLLQMVVGIADTLMVSYAGEATVSGVSLDTMLYTIFIYLFTAIATGGAVIVSQYLGSGSKVGADSAAGQIYRLALIVSLVCMTGMLLFGRFVLSLLYSSVEPDVMAACRTYLWIVTLSFPANAVYNAGAALYRSMGRTRTTMYVSVAMNLLNVVGNAIGIFVFRAGAAGVAWPTTLSWYFAAVVMTVLCMDPKSQVTMKPALVMKRDREMARRITGIAVPNAVENTLFQLAKVLLGALIATFGTSQIAANGIGQTLWSLAACMSVSMNPVFITVIGQCMGARDTEAADWYMRKLLRLSLCLAVLWNALVLALTPVILPLYSITAETRRLVWIIVLIHNCFSAFVQPFAMPLSAGMRAAGDVRFAMWSSIFATVICRTLLSFVFGLWMGMGVIGIALAMGADWCIKGGLDIWRWKSGKWKQFNVIG
ncbi:MAG: MATE family efflux transporter [Oscillospiraceae bacterium]|nr:MATE family efflux transporter [Oscillospiraceae bacterium]